MNDIEKARQAEQQKARENYESTEVLAVKSSIVVQNHLSDAQIEFSVIVADEEKQNELRIKANKRMNFVKFIINKLHGDLTYDINPNTLWEEFIENN